MIYLELFLTFFMIGAFTFGGGYAMLPLMQEQVALRWSDIIPAETIVNFVAVSESTPGPFAVNMATYVGTEVGGLLGAACATLGVVLPSFITILLISFVLKEFQQVQVVQYAFTGIRAGVLALIVKALWGMYAKSKKNAVSYIVMAAAFILVAFFDVSALPVLAGCAVFGLVTSEVMRRRAAQ